MDEEAVPGSALGGAGNFLPAPKEIELIVAKEALAGACLVGGRGKFRGNSELGESSLKPLVHPAVAFKGRERIPWVAGRKGQTVGPIVAMRHEAAGGGAADEGAEEGESLDLGVFLEVTEGGGFLNPTVETKDRLAQARHGLEEGFVEGHVEGVVLGAGHQEEPVGLGGGGHGSDWDEGRG